MKPKSKAKPKPKSPDAARKQILADHRQIGQLTGRIAAVESPEDATTCLQQLQPLLQRHFQEEEDEMDGLHAEILKRCPELHNSMRELKSEHEALLENIAQLLAAMSPQGRPRAALAKLKTLGKQLQQRLAAHEAKETAIFVDSIWTDSGEGD